MTDNTNQLYRIISQRRSWTYDSTFGIIHRHGCQVCHNYKTHLHDADESDPGYAHAVQDREAELQNRYLDGFHQGRETQRQHENKLAKKYRSQRDSALESRSLYKVMLEEAEVEVARLRDELLNLRVAYEGLRPRTPLEDFNWMASGGGAFDEPDYDYDSEGCTDESSDEYEEDSRAPVLACTESDGEDEDVEDGMGSLTGRTGYPIETFDRSSREDLIEPDEGPYLSIFSAHLSIDDDRGTSHVENRRSHLQSNPPLGPSPRRDPVRPPNVPPHRPVYTEEGIRRKMELACIAGNDRTLAAVKSLVSAAHLTPSHERTPVQRILLSEWRNPTYPSPYQTSLWIHPSEVYVDASQDGIGFVFNNQWQAWKLKKGWRNRSREIMWAEAVAVELGVRLMIAAGYRRRTLWMRSDNSGVVTAISNNEVYRSQIGGTVRRIYRLCKKHAIKLEIEWIAGRANPADDPSRLCPEEGTSRFPHVIMIPNHLREFVFHFSH